MHCALVIAAIFAIAVSSVNSAKNDTVALSNVNGKTTVTLPGGGTITGDGPTNIHFGSGSTGDSSSSSSSTSSSTDANGNTVTNMTTTDSNGNTVSNTSNTPIKPIGGDGESDNMGDNMGDNGSDVSMGGKNMTMSGSGKNMTMGGDSDNGMNMTMGGSGGMTMGGNGDGMTMGNGGMTMGGKNGSMSACAMAASTCASQPIKDFTASVSKNDVMGGCKSLQTVMACVKDCQDFSAALTNNTMYKSYLSLCGKSGSDASPTTSHGFLFLGLALGAAALL